ncbi:WD40-repeat-containing domain protein [Mariannaea sp. PMI_226]|nr:WD40-repeat-containing domain protein [Mariannaea sp. PMI_226]
MSPSMTSPPIRGDGELDSTSKRHTRSISTPVTPKARRQSLTSESQGAPITRQDTQSSRYSTTHISQTNSLQNAKDANDSKGPSRTSTPSPPPNAGLDPLSTQIFLRTNSNLAEQQPTIAQRLRNTTGRPGSPANDNRKSFDLSKTPNVPEFGKERKKGSSFLSRLGMRSGWKKEDDMLDSDSELGDLRTDGINARALTSVIGAGGGYIPLHKEPPRYIRVKAHNKKDREFNHLFLAQELMGPKNAPRQNQQGRAPAVAVGSKLMKPGDAIWAAEFSLDGRYLAVAGKDQVVRVFAVISTEEERKAHEEEEAQNGATGERLSAPVFRSKPVKEFRGHTGEVLALSWSKNNFLLSSSMDKTVRLWHMTRNDCLCSFTHKDLVTSIAFHPTDDRFFLAGSLDSQLRLWSITDRTVAFEASTGEFITAVAFTPDGKMAICGVLSGMASFYLTEGLKLRYQIHVRSSRGKNAKGSKITGIRTMTIPSGPEAGQTKVLISSNDSRVRVYNINDKVVQVKYRGLENQSSQIHARFSDDGNYVISGSEDRRAYIWKLNAQDNDVRDKQPYESFDAHPEVVTTALMAPTKTRLLLSASGDPVYDLCNPPPVTLRSLEESATSQTALSEEEEGSDTRSVSRHPEESPLYQERSKHFDGHIVVTTDRTGTIKVFRQDCAYSKRQRELWETGSKFSGRIAGVGRSGSIITRTSGGGSRMQSRRSSLNIGPNGPNAVQLQHATDRINSWRMDIDGIKPSLNVTPTRDERSVSPAKAKRSSVNNSAATLASEARKQPYLSSPVPRSQNPASPTGSVTSRTTFKSTTRDRNNGNTLPAAPPTPSFSLISASDSDSKEDKGGEGSFWSLNRWRGNIPGLRYSSIISSPLSDSHTQPTQGGRTKTGNELQVPREKSNRMSLGIGELGRFKNEELANRRKSAGPLMMTRSQDKDGKASFDAREYLTTGKKRVDSGVGPMSGDSSESD